MDRRFFLFKWKGDLKKNEVEGTGQEGIRIWEKFVAADKACMAIF